MKSSSSDIVAVWKRSFDGEQASDSSTAASSLLFGLRGARGLVWWKVVGAVVLIVS